MPGNLTSMLMIAAVIGLFVLIVGLIVSGRRGALDVRLDALSGRSRLNDRPETVGSMARSALPRMGKVIVPEDKAERTKLTAKLVHAGLYSRQAMHVFLGVKLIMLLIATIVGVGLTLSKALPATQTLPISMILFLIGMIGPSFWLDRCKTARQIALRRALPDALDVLTICLEGGLSLQGAIKRVSDELYAAHPILGAELRIIDREIQLGRPPGEALANFARRTDLEEALSLASVIGQSERFGASLVKSLANHSETLRIKRKQKAEEKAQKAATKVLLPTLLFIFPAVFVILLAPAAIQVTKILSESPQP